jgi:hypothetical protein
MPQHFRTDSAAVRRKTVESRDSGEVEQLGEAEKAVADQAKADEDAKVGRKWYSEHGTRKFSIDFIRFQR